MHPCHRLDRGTSGLILYAKGKSSQRKMMELFRGRGVKKQYIALARGAPLQAAGRINRPIEGKTAVTEYRVLGKRKDYSVLEVTPLTGRTNQIRIHLASIGCPILGETRFAFRRDFKVKAKRLCLHAAGLEFTHPLTGQKISLSSVLPKEFKHI